MRPKNSCRSLFCEFWAHPLRGRSLPGSLFARCYALPPRGRPPTGSLRGLKVAVRAAWMNRVGTKFLSGLTHFCHHLNDTFIPVKLLRQTKTT
jgi:hypothetical protein